MNPWDQVREAVSAANSLNKAVDASVGDMARLCAGRLRRAEVSSWVLKNLKDELRDYNVHTGRWK